MTKYPVCTTKYCHVIPFMSIFIPDNTNHFKSRSVNGDITGSEHAKLDLKDEQL